MKRPFSVRRRSAAHTGFTLIELLVATALSLLLLGVVITMFGQVSESITASRAMLEAADRLRLAEQRLHLDLAGVTAIVNPPGRPENNRGYFEYIEGPVGLRTAGGTSTTLPSTVAKNTDKDNTDDDSVGDFDDILMMTIYSPDRPFIGKFGSGTIQSHYAEVAWFVRGHMLHRRVLLVVPGAVTNAPAAGFYEENDVSVHVNLKPDGTLDDRVTANTLADLTRRECRFAHDLTAFPYSVNVWGQLGLPTLAECSNAAYDVSKPPTGACPGAKTTIDFWKSHTSRVTDNLPWADDVLFVANPNCRLSDDIILTNVIGFDVRVWDPTATIGGSRGAYVDLGYDTNLTPPTQFSKLGDKNSSLMAAGNDYPRVYDTYSITHFDARGANGIDDQINGTANGVVDDDEEKSQILEVASAVLVSCARDQVKIRIFEPDSKQIREVTVVQDFLPQQRAETDATAETLAAPSAVPETSRKGAKAQRKSREK